MIRRNDQETTITWIGTDETAEVFTNMPSIIKRLEGKGYEGEVSGHGTIFEVPVGIILGGKNGGTKRETNRPTKTHDEKVAHLFRLRKGKMEKANGKALTKKQAQELMAYCEERVTAKEQDEEPEAPAPAPEPKPKSSKGKGKGKGKGKSKKEKPAPEPEPDDDEDDTVGFLDSIDDSDFDLDSDDDPDEELTDLDVDDLL